MANSLEQNQLSFVEDDIEFVRRFIWQDDQKLAQ